MTTFASIHKFFDSGTGDPYGHYPTIPITVTDSRGNVEVTNVYNADNRIVSQAHPDGGV